MFSRIQKCLQKIVLCFIDFKLKIWCIVNLIHMYTAERMDELGCTSVMTNRFPKAEICPEGEARGTSRSPREISEGMYNPIHPDST